jgi:uncharacterized protein (TIGR02265 family)
MTSIPDGPPGHVKGNPIVATRTFVTERYGQDAWKRVLAALPPSDVAVIADALPIGWYRIEVLQRLNRATETVLGDGGGGIARLLGRRTAEIELTTIHRVLLKVATPWYVVERLTMMWQRVQDTGEWKVERVSDTQLIATLTGWAISDEIMCIRLAAFFERTLELSGAQAPVIRRGSCIGRGERSCRFDVSWR